eukprot:1158855-Pelagomonas_calceolata.AAC.11
MSRMQSDKGPGIILRSHCSFACLQPPTITAPAPHQHGYRSSLGAAAAGFAPVSPRSERMRTLASRGSRSKSRLGLPLEETPAEATPGTAPPLPDDSRRSERKLPGRRVNVPWVKEPNAAAEDVRLAGPDRALMYTGGAAV